jgi:hypothetical protein
MTNAECRVVSGVQEGIQAATEGRGLKPWLVVECCPPERRLVGQGEMGFGH